MLLMLMASHAFTHNYTASRRWCVFYINLTTNKQSSTPTDSNNACTIWELTICSISDKPFISLPPPRRLCDRCCLSFCLSAGLLKKWWADFVETWCYDWAYQSKELINFWWWSGPGHGFQVTFPFPSPLQNRGFYEIY